MNINGTSGNDTLSGNSASDVITAYGGNDTVQAGSGNDAVYGGDGNDSLSGQDGNDTLVGGAGTNELFGGAGNDVFVAGAGADLLDGGSGQDNVDYSASSAGVTVNLSTGAVSGGDAANDRLGGGMDGVIGSGFADSLTGFDEMSTSGSDIYTNQFWGGAGNDSLSGLGGNDLLYGGADQDLIYGGADSDLVQGDDGNDVLYGDAGRDTLDGGADHDTLYGGEDEDRVSGGAGNDALYGGAARDTMDGGDGDDGLSGGDGEDSLIGGKGQDSLDGGQGQDTLTAGEGADRLDGGTGDDKLYGGAGADLLDGGDNNDLAEGGDGNDTLTGGAGVDSLYGGNDADLFIGPFGPGSGDFVDGGEGGVDNDTLNLGGLGPHRVVYSNGNPENGKVEFLNAQGSVTGSMTFTNIERIVPCFTPGTLIATPRGEVPVESLQVGDRIITRDNGVQRLRWVGQRDLSLAHLLAKPQYKPILVRKGALGHDKPDRDLLVSPNHRLLVANDRTSLYFDEHEVLVAAKHLTHTRGAASVMVPCVSYLHFLCDQHEVVLSNGTWTESFQPGEHSLRGLDEAAQDEIFGLFPDLRLEAGRRSYGAARRTLKRHEALLVAR